MSLYTDQLGNKVHLSHPPERIVSLVPSQTELLADLGLDAEVVGITKFCIHPESWFKTKTKIGGTKKINIELIRQLQPDLIIGNKEENTQRDIEALSRDFPVWMSDIYNLNDAKGTITAIGDLTGRQPEAAYLNHLVSAGFADLEILAPRYQFYKKKVLYLIWRNPYMAAGNETFIHDILEKTGWSNVLTDSRYPVLSMAEIKAYAPDYILLSSEPYPFKEVHLRELQEEVPGVRVLLVNGEMFSWYGSRLVKAIQYLFELQKDI